MADIIPFPASDKTPHRHKPESNGLLPEFSTWSEAFKATKWMRLEMQEDWFFVMADGLPSDKDYLVVALTNLYEAIKSLRQRVGREKLRQLNGVQIFLSAKSLHWSSANSSKQLCLHIPIGATEDDIEASIVERLQKGMAN